MLILRLLFLIPTAIFALNYANHGNPQHSMDYNNDPYNRYSQVNPGSNLIFNFEQLRRDQPPQIEMRDESLGLYMHARPTTMAPIVVPNIKTIPENNEFASNNQFSRFSNLPAPVHTEYNRQSTPMYHQYNPNPSTPMPSPPPAPKWSDFSEAFNKQHFPHDESRKPYEHNPAVPELNQFRRPQLQPTRADERPFEQKKPSVPGFNHFQSPQHQPTAPVENANQVHGFRRNSMPPAHDYVSSSKNVENSRQQQNMASRGSHKFSWNDLVTEPSWNHEPQKMSSTSAPVAQGQNPPPMPTLTPWLDGFGK